MKRVVRVRIAYNLNTHPISKSHVGCEAENILLASAEKEGGKSMRVLKVCPNQEPVLVDIGDDYESTYQIIGGYIERIFPFDDPVAIICNEEGKLLNLPLNRAIVVNGKIKDVIAGNFIITGLKNGISEISLSDELAKKYMEIFKAPEMFIRTSDGIAVIKC